MDVQMPVMDGLTATRAIRNIERFATLPIIAMTAHTMAHEITNCIAAGMNDHIGKPFNDVCFYNVLVKWVPPDKQSLQPAASSGPAVTAAACSLPALRGVDTCAGLALLLGNEARYRHWLSDFVSEAPITMQNIRQALAAGESETASAAAHALKGRAGLLGMSELNTIASALETAIDHAGPTDELLRDLEENVAAMVVEIQRKLDLPENTAATTDSPLPPGVPPACVARLISSLESGDGDCDLRLVECLAELEGTVWTMHLQQAQSAVGNFDYAMASRILSGITPKQPRESC
jgi:CheY-like chemotaxis protein